MHWLSRLSLARMYIGVGMLFWVTFPVEIRYGMGVRMCAPSMPLPSPPSTRLSRVAPQEACLATSTSGIPCLAKSPFSLATNSARRIGERDEAQCRLLHLWPCALREHAAGEGCLDGGHEGSGSGRRRGLPHQVAPADGHALGLRLLRHVPAHVLLIPCCWRRAMPMCRSVLSGPCAVPNKKAAVPSSRGCAVVLGSAALLEGPALDPKRRRWRCVVKNGYKDCANSRSRSKLMSFNGLDGSAGEDARAVMPIAGASCGNCVQCSEHELRHPSVRLMGQCARCPAMSEASNFGPANAPIPSAGSFADEVSCPGSAAS